MSEEHEEHREEIETEIEESTDNEDIDFIEYIQDQKVIGSIGSPNRVEDYYIDFNAKAMNDHLHGRVLAFVFEEYVNEQPKQKIILSIITDMIARNPWHESDILKAIIRDRGEIPYLSESSRTMSGRLQLLSALVPEENKLKASVIGNPPKSGTLVYNMPKNLLRYYDVTSKWYLGYFKQDKVPIPISLRHFGQNDYGNGRGLGEAHFTGIFGKTGSGKSIFATQVILGYARHNNMGILILDPQGEFSSNNFSKDTFEWDFFRMLRSVRQDPQSITRLSFSNLIFEDINLFARFIIESGLMKDITNASLGYLDSVGEAFIDALKRQKQEGEDAGDTFDISRYTIENLQIALEQAVDRAYTSTSTRNDKQEHIRELVQHKHIQERYDTIIDMFSASDVNRITIRFMVREVIHQNRCIILNLDDSELRSIGSIEYTRIKTYLIQRIINVINEQASELYLGRQQEQDRDVSALVVIDEAHYIVPQSQSHFDQEQKILSREIQSAVKTTRKYGIGWLFITQLITDFSKEIYKNLHNYYFLYGLQIGQDRTHVVSIVGKDNTKLYDSIADPKSTGKYPVMISGSVVTFSTRGSPIVLIGPESDREFMQLNELEERFEAESSEVNEGTRSLINQEDQNYTIEG